MAKSATKSSPSASKASKDTKTKAGKVTKKTQSKIPAAKSAVKKVKSEVKDKGSSSKGDSTSQEDAIRKEQGYNEPLPKRNAKGELVFQDYPEMRPNMTPKEVLQAGSFGGTYFRPIKSSVTGEKYSGVWKELPKNWLEGLDISRQVASSPYRMEVNTYKVKCGGSLEMWESSGWIAAHRVTLDMLTYVGLALSVAALVCTLTTFGLLKLMKSQRTIIHTNLCIALLSAQLLYLIGIERTASSELCTTIAVLLHYLFTSTFSWMLMEGVYILMQSRSAYGKGGKTWMYMLAGWGSPVVIIGVSLGIRLDGYGTDDFCWLSVENGFMWAFATPVLAVLAMNTIVLIMVIRVFMALKANLDKTEAERLRAGVRAVLLLQPLLGFTWIFGLLAAYDASLFFAYMFVIFNSLQGVFIFIVNCLMNEEVKKAFRTKYHRSGGRRRRSTHTTQISTTDTSVAFKTTRAFVDRSRATSKANKGSSVTEGLAIKLRSTKVQPISDDKASTKM